MIGKSYSFRVDVFRNYRQASHVDALAQCIGIEKRSFSRQFKEEFDMSPYQWLLKQKSKHICFSLAESGESLDKIRKEFGFKFAGHFTRFCKEQFACTPLRLRNIYAGSTNHLMKRGVRKCDEQAKDTLFFFLN